MTTPEPPWLRIKTLFEEALDLPDADRDAFVARIDCDTATRAELQSLLHHHAVSGNTDAGTPGFMAGSAASALAGVLGDSAADSLAGQAARVGQRLGAWEIVRPIGSGGMGEVFEARRADGQYDGRAAVKLLKRGMDSAAVLQRFALERQALARLNHPHIARLLDAGASAQGLPYFVLEFVNGQPIDTVVRGQTLTQRLQLFLQLADAVAYAHRNLLVHRDLKPGNVLVDAEGQVKLLDFGITKALDPLEHAHGHTTVAGQRPFTPHYASPEQIRGEPVTTATDIYSLGVLLYQLLTGTRPTGRKATTPAEAARSVLEDEPTRPSRLTAQDTPDPQWLQTRKKLEGDLDNILLKTLEKAPERRYASVDALAADVQAFLDGRPVSARPAGAAYVLGKFVRRNRWAVLAGSLGGVGLATGLAAALLQGREAAALGVVGLAGGLGMALLQSRQATLARDLAQSRLADTRAIVSDVMVRHADTIQYLPGGLRLKAELLENMIGHLDRLASQARGDAALVGEVAMAYSRLADLQSDNNVATLNQGAAGDANAIKALALFEAGDSAHARNPEFATWWARAWRTRALAARQRADTTEALRSVQAMEDAVRRGLLLHAGNATLLSELGSALFLRGQLHNSQALAHLGQPEAALAAFAQAEPIYQQLLHSDNRASADDLATYRHQLGTIAGARMLVEHNRGHDAAAVGFGEEAVAWRQQNLALQPEHVAFRNGLAIEANNLATVLLDIGDAARALPFCDLTAQHLLHLEQQEPDTPTWRETRVRLSLHQARALRGVGRPEAALPVLLTLLDADWLQRSPAGAWRLAWTRLELALCRCALRQQAAALADAQAAHQALAARLDDTASDRADDAESWLLLALAQSLLHTLAGAEQQAHWQAAHAASVARARLAGPLLARQLKRAGLQ